MRGEWFVCVGLGCTLHDTARGQCDGQREVIAQRNVPPRGGPHVKNATFRKEQIGDGNVADLADFRVDTTFFLPLLPEIPIDAGAGRGRDFAPCEL